MHKFVLVGCYLLLNFHYFSHFSRTKMMLPQQEIYWCLPRDFEQAVEFGVLPSAPGITCKKIQ